MASIFAVLNDAAPIVRDRDYNAQEQVLEASLHRPLALSTRRRSRFLSRRRLKINSPLHFRCASLFLLLLLGMLFSVVDAQFKMIDSANFRMKKGVSNSSASIAFVQINHYVDPVGDQSRAFTIEQHHQGDDPNLIKVHIQYQNANDIHGGGNVKLLSSMETDRGEFTNGSSNLHRIMENNKNRKIFPQRNESFSTKFQFYFQVTNTIQFGASLNHDYNWSIARRLTLSITPFSAHIFFRKTNEY